MTKKDIMAIIRANNINKDIKWDAHSTKNNGIVVITNDYSEEVKFTITKHMYDDIGAISVRDNFAGMTVGTLLKGDDRWSDFSEWDNGVEMAVKATVRSFYNRY